jgi:chemotaxis protein histidine kinase CheA
MSFSGNAEQFKHSFREEAREILTDLEAALLELNENRGDAEVVGRIFRALHTIKGSGAMFGFERLASFTHNLETAFDLVRNGRLEPGANRSHTVRARSNQSHAGRGHARGRACRPTGVRPHSRERSSACRH